ncbi:MAG: histidine phosphatase family protein [Gammaproteobacteria bacterium]|nr:MAG: histidine phosphatase family protein [Gammaproteobacteria bacterium]
MREKEPRTRIVFLRHGHTGFPLDRVYCDDREDPALDEEGQAQAADAARLLQAAEPLAAIYASPALRTRMTAEPVARAFGLEVATDERLRERRFGVWEGLRFQEIEERYPEQYAAWKRDKAGYTPEGGETMHQVLERLEAALAEIRARHPGATVLVVSHVGPIRLALAQALGMPVAAYRRIAVDYGACSRVDYGRTQHDLIYANLSLRRLAGAS